MFAIVGIYWDNFPDCINKWKPFSSSQYQGAMTNACVALAKTMYEFGPRITACMIYVIQCLANRNSRKPFSNSAVIFCNQPQ